MDWIVVWLGGLFTNWTDLHKSFGNPGKIKIKRHLNSTSGSTTSYMICLTCFSPGSLSCRHASDFLFLTKLMPSCLHLLLPSAWNVLSALSIIGSFSNWRHYLNTTNSETISQLDGHLPNPVILYSIPVYFLPRSDYFPFPPLKYQLHKS